MRVIKVTADLDEKRANANEVRADLEARFLPLLKNRYPGVRYTMEGEGTEQKESMADVLRGFAVALFASMPCWPSLSDPSPSPLLSCRPFPSACWGPFWDI